MQMIKLDNAREEVLVGFIDLLESVGSASLDEVAKLVDGHPWLLQARYGQPFADWEVSDDDYTRSGLHIALGANRPELIALLIDRGAPVNGRDSDGRTALADLMQFSGSDFGVIRKLAQVLIDRGAACETVDNTGRSLLYEVMSFHLPDLAAHYVRSGAPLDAFDLQGSHHLSGLLRSHRGYLAPNELAQPFRDYVDQLLDWGLGTRVEPNHAVAPLIVEFIDRGWFEQAERLIERGFNVHRTGVGGATLLSQTKTAQGVRWLLGHGLDVDARDHQGRTALFRQLDYPEVMAALIVAGADPSIGDHEGLTTPETLFSSQPRYGSLLTLVRSVQAQKEAVQAVRQLRYAGARP